MGRNVERFAAFARCGNNRSGGMRRALILLAGFAAGSAAFAAPAQAQDVPGQIFRTITTPFRILAGTVAPRRTRSYATAPLSLAPAAQRRQPASARATPRPRTRAAAISPRTDQPRTAAEIAPELRPTPGPAVAALERRPEARPPDPPTGGAGGWLGPLYWPYAADDLFDYAFVPSNALDWFWARGSGDLFDAIFMRAGDARAGWAEMCGSRRGGSNSWIDSIRQAINPTQAQVQLINELRDALVKAGNEVRSACPATNTVADPSQRLEAMTDRLWAVRQAVVVIRMPLEKLTSSLSAEQQTRLNAVNDETVAQPLLPGSSARGPGNRSMPACGPPMSPFAEWPAAEIEQRVRPADGQRQALEMLRMTTLGMTQFLMASCPSETPRSPLARVDAAEKRLDALLYAARVVAPAVNGFYLALADEQKTAFRSLGRLAGAPVVGRGER
jgi:LTXXQ motif family protein